MEPIGLSISETGKVLGGADDPLSTSTIYRKIRSGELEAMKIGARTLVTIASIRQLVDNAPRLAA